MAEWSKQAYQDMADLITEQHVSADDVATLRHLINEWADARGHSGGTKRFPVPNNAMFNEVEVKFQDGEIWNVSVVTT